MKIGDSEITLLSDGSFTLEVGACFGVVPKKIWSRSVTENDRNRVRMSLNVPLIRTPEWEALVDSGIGKSPDERTAKIYETSKSEDLLDQVSGATTPAKINYIVHSHLHFDHMGHSFETVNGSDPFPSATRVMQEDEKNNMLNQNEVTRGSYLSPDLLGGGFSISTVSGSERIRDGLRVVKTGGHTSGHQAVIYENGGKGMIYFGDILPTSFNLKLPYITAIDTFPLDTLEMKRKLIGMAIEKGYVCVFNHDSVTRAAFLSGSVDDIRMEAADL